MEAKGGSFRRAFLDNQFNFLIKRQKLFGYEPTYKGLKRRNIDVLLLHLQRYEPTYKGLKRLMSTGGEIRRGGLRAYL